MPSSKVARISKSQHDVVTERAIATVTFDLTQEVQCDDFVKGNIPEDIIFPEELNKFLRDQIRELTAEKGSLRRSLDECEEKLSKLTDRKSESHTEIMPAALIPGSVRASEIAASKIIGLSKKCRERTAEVEALKTKCKNLESKLSASEIHPQCKKSRGNEITGKCSFDSGDGNIIRASTLEEELKCREKETKVLREKLHHINSKLYESKNTCTYLRQEINKAQKLICSEVGDNVTIASLASSGHQNGWRGRAEQIQQLQQKVTELQSKLCEYEGTCKGSITTTLTERGRCTRNLRNIEKEKRQKAEESAKELREISLALEASKRKQDAAKARIKVLENDLTTAKQSIAIMNEKRSHDDQLIQALNAQLKVVEAKYRDREREVLLRNRAEDKSMTICSEVYRLQEANKNLQRTIEERKIEIDSLRGQSSIVSCCNCRNSSPPSRGKSSNSPPVTSRNTGDYNEYVTLGMSAEAERKRLLELVVVLNRRLDEERFATDKMAETLRNERNKLARLETKLQRLEMERVGVTSGLHSGYKLRCSKSATATTTNENSKDETRFKIELLEEECLALKARLVAVQRDKTSDLTLYKQMLDQARKIFQDAYIQRKNSHSNSCSMITI